MISTKTLLLKHYYRRQGFGQQITAISRFLPLELWCSEGHLAQFDLILTFLTKSDLCRPILPGGPDLFFTNFESRPPAQGRAGHLRCEEVVERIAEITAVVFTACGGLQSFSKHEVRAEIGHL